MVMHKRIPVTREALEENQHADWNAFVELLTMTEYEELIPIQRPAYLVFWYESEVQNGGHLQYFTNFGDERGEETIQSLKAVGADLQVRILEQALERWESAGRLPIADVQEHATIALEGEFDDLDDAFYSCVPQLGAVLERYFAEHGAAFVEYR